MKRLIAYYVIGEGLKEKMNLFIFASKTSPHVQSRLRD
jgi:hypothetical protein